ncbi:hypothetical protein OUZ56_005773 [Daphnia magna]|uniref:Uncharacterized protein n=1 Tax=Daphnia magna TaxID=35525 RepID=A0ABQ9YV36_9CRUS|nr:hypothetical protein OUZ56_005773 [Daphnia magna]
MDIFNRCLHQGHLRQISHTPVCPQMMRFQVHPFHLHYSSKTKRKKARKTTEKVIVEGSRRSSRIQARQKVGNVSVEESQETLLTVLCMLCKSTVQPHMTATLSVDVRLPQSQHGLHGRRVFDVVEKLRAYQSYDYVKTNKRSDPTSVTTKHRKRTEIYERQSTTYGKAFGDVAQAFLDTHKTSEKFLFETCNAANQDPDGTNKQAVAENNQYPNSAFEMDFLNSGIEEELITLNNTVPASTTMSIMVPVAPAQPVFSYDTYPSILAFTALPISFASPPPDLDAISKAKELSKTLSPNQEGVVGGVACDPLGGCLFDTFLSLVYVSLNDCHVSFTSAGAGNATIKGPRISFLYTDRQIASANTASMEMHLYPQCNAAGSYFNTEVCMTEGFQEYLQRVSWRW